MWSTQIVYERIVQKPDGLGLYTVLDYNLVQIVEGRDVRFCGKYGIALLFKTKRKTLIALAFAGRCIPPIWPLRWRPAASLRRPGR